MFYSADNTIERLVFRDWGVKTVQDVPFQLIDPQGGRVKNVILLYGPQGNFQVALFAQTPGDNDPGQCNTWCSKNIPSAANGNSGTNSSFFAL